jgi:hypothetical protein
MQDSTIKIEPQKDSNRPKLFLISVVLFTAVALLLAVVTSSITQQSEQNIVADANSAYVKIIDPSSVELIFAEEPDATLGELPETGTSCLPFNFSPTPFVTCAPTTIPTITPTRAPGTSPIPTPTRAPGVSPTYIPTYTTTPSPVYTRPPYTPRPGTTVQSTVSLTIKDEGKCTIRAVKYLLRQDIMYFLPGNIIGGQGSSAYEFAPAHNTKMVGSYTYTGISMDMFKKHTVYQRNRIAVLSTTGRWYDLGAFYSRPLNGVLNGITYANKDIVVPCK